MGRGSGGVNSMTYFPIIYICSYLVLFIYIYVTLLTKHEVMGSEYVNCIIHFFFDNVYSHSIGTPRLISFGAISPCVPSTRACKTGAPNGPQCC